MATNAQMCHFGGPTGVNSDHVYAQGAVVPGDSGSGIISDDGQAVGVIVTTGIHSTLQTAPPL